MPEERPSPEDFKLPPKYVAMQEKMEKLLEKMHKQILNIKELQLSTLHELQTKTFGKPTAPVDAESMVGLVAAWKEAQFQKKDAFAYKGQIYITNFVTYMVAHWKEHMSEYDVARVKRTEHAKDSMHRRMLRDSKESDSGSA